MRLLTPGTALQQIWGAAVGKAQSPGQAWPTVCFSMVCELRMMGVFFYTFKWLKKCKKAYFMTHENCMKFKCQCPGIKLSWHIATSISLTIICPWYWHQLWYSGELSHWKRSFYFLVFYRRGLFILDLEYVLLGRIAVLSSMHCNTFARKCRCPRGLHCFMFPPAMSQSSYCSTFLRTLGFVRF